jgi:hypothetical protein
MTQTAAEVLRDYETDGVPASGIHEVNKRNLKELLMQYEAELFTPGSVANGDFVGGALAESMVFSTSTVDADPGQGKIRLNRSSQDAATIVFISDESPIGTDLTGLLDAAGTSDSAVKGWLRIGSPGAAQAIIFEYTSISAASGYFKVNGTVIASSSTSPFASDDNVLLAFSVAGDKGATGAAGSNGAAGSTGATGATGAPGLGTFRGTWSGATAYVTADVVYLTGIYYIALQNGTNHSPDVAPTYWSIVAFKGAVRKVAPAGSFGAITADYTTDGTADQTEINAAVAAVAAAGGGAVFVSAGAYSISHNIIGASKVHLIAEARGAVTITLAVGYTSVALAGQTLNGAIAYVAMTDFSVSGFIVDGRTNTITQNGIVAIPDDGGSTLGGTPCSRFRISDNIVKCRKDHSYHIWSVRGIDGEIVHNYVDGGYTNADTWAGTEVQEGIETYGSTNVLVAWNTIKGVGNAALNLFIGPEAVAGIPDCGLDRVRMIGNIIDTCGKAVQCWGYTDSVNGAPPMQACVIADNTATNIKVSGIEVAVLVVDGFDDPFLFVDNSITNNRIRMADSGQLSTSQAFGLGNQHTSLAALDAASKRNIVKGNTFSNCLNTNAAGRVNLVYFRGFEFSDNKVVTEGQTTGLSQGIYSIGNDDFHFDGNLVSGSPAVGVLMQTCTNFTIENNNVEDWNLNASGSAAIFVEESSADGSVIGNRMQTSTLDSVQALVVISSNSSGINTAIPNNYYANTDYSGLAVVFVGSEVTHNLNRLPGAVVCKALGTLNAFSFVNIVTNSGNTCAQPASSTTNKPADGFIVSATASGSNVLVHTLYGGVMEGTSGLTPGATYYAVDSGGASSTAPVTSGVLKQIIGKALSATKLIFLPRDGALIP